MDLLSRTLSLLRKPPRLTVSEWCDRHLYLPREGNAEPGKYRITRMPYQRAMLDDALDSSAQEVVWMIASQLGKTACLVGITSYFIHQDPTAILVVYPTLDSAKSWSREKLTPTLKETPALRGLVRDARSRDSENTTLNKKFPGGNITVCGANSPSGLRQRSKRVVIQDEIDAFEVNSEGDPMKQADKRAETFHNAVKIKASTPTIKGASRIEALYKDSDQQQWFCPCPRCGQHQTLKWSQVKWPDGKPEEACYECEHCKAALTDGDRISMILNGEWRPTAPFKGIRGRHMNGLYRVIGRKKSSRSYLHEFAMEAIAAKHRGKFDIMVWVNTFLAETFEDQAEKIEASGLMKRAEAYGPELPDDVLVLTAGVDVQKDRLEVEIVGWGKGDESWGVLYAVIPGNALMPATWCELDTLLSKQWQTVSGRSLHITAACVDSGDFTQEVYTYAKPRFARRIFAVKGSNTAGDPIVSSLRRSNRMRCPVYRIGTDQAKGLIYGRLKIEEPGPGYMHFPQDRKFGFDENYFSMLTAEEIRTEFHKGFPRRVWIKTRPRNEALDCRVYATAALAILQPDWGLLSKHLARKQKTSQGGTEKTVDNVETQTPDEPPATPPPASRGTKFRQRRGGWVTSWRW